MTNSVEIIKALQATNSRLDKEQILADAWSSGNKDFFLGAKLCYDPFTTFGVADKMVLSKSDDIVKTPKSKFSDFISLTDKLKNRTLTGNSAREEIDQFISHTSEEDWELFYKPILLKDLRCGISETTINKVLKKLGKETTDYIVTVFECALAQDGKEEVFEGKQILQHKPTYHNRSPS